MCNKSVIFCLVALLILVQSVSYSDKRVDFIPSHKVSPLDSQKQSVVGKGNIPLSIPQKEIVPIEQTEVQIVQPSTKLKDELKKTSRIKSKSSRGKRTKEVTRDANLIMQTMIALDSSSQQTESTYTEDTMQSDVYSSDADTPAHPTVSGNENGIFARSINVFAFIIVLGALVLVILQINGYFSRKVTQPVSTFITNLNEEIIPVIQQPKRKEKDIFATITERENRPILESSDDDTLEIESASEAVNHDTVYLARQFGRGDGEVELAMKMMTHRKPSVISTHYSTQATMIGNTDAQNKTGRKKDASVIAKKLGIGKGEVLLARHLEDLVQHQTKG